MTHSHLQLRSNIVTKEIGSFEGSKGF